jgi:glycosyltransferase involved in cell wall biosynthesis
MPKTILFYSSVRTKKMFSIQSYYRNDILILKDLGYNVSLSKSFFDFLLFWKYDISFLYFYRYSLVAAIISKCFNKKIYFTGGIDALDIQVATKAQKYLQEILFRLCNYISDTSILVSQTDQNNVRKIYKGKLPANCSLSYHAINFENFEFTGDFYLKKNNFVTIAWMLTFENTQRKGVDKAIRVFSYIKKHIPDCLFYIAGPSGAGSDYILHLISELHLEESVIYLGAIEEIEKLRLLKESRFYFQLSSYEGFGIAAIEALAAGCQVIHSGRGGLQDGVSNYGYQVDIDDEQEIVDLLLDLYEKEIDIELLKKGIQHIKQNFSYKKRFDSLKVIIGH